MEPDEIKFTAGMFGTFAIGVLLGVLGMTAAKHRDAEPTVLIEFMDGREHVLQRVTVETDSAGHWEAWGPNGAKCGGTIR